MNDVLNPEIVEDEESSLRPGDFDEYIGQTNLKENLKVFVGAAKLRDESLDHVLLYGPPGLGKTTMSMIIAHEMGTNIKITTGPSIEKTGEHRSVSEYFNSRYLDGRTCKTENCSGYSG